MSDSLDKIFVSLISTESNNEMINQCDACDHPDGEILLEHGLALCSRCRFAIDSAKLLEKHYLLKWFFLTISDRPEADQSEDQLFLN